MVKALRLFLLVQFLFGAAMAWATDDRVALVVGNGAYLHAVPLENPSNDAKALSTKLEGLDFNVIQATDLDTAGFQSALRRFSEALRGAKVGLFFYAGHGLQVDGQNYLAGVDARLLSEADLLFETLKLEDVLRVMESSVPTRLVFLDACRDNPLSRSLARSMGTRSSAVGRGLARVNAGAGTLIAYATAPGDVALDGINAANSPFTSGLIEHIETPGLDIGQMLRRVRQSVMTDTQGQQVPWSTESLTGDFYFVEPETWMGEEEGQSGTGGSKESQVELMFWDTIKDSDEPRDFEAYLEQWPEGVFVALARNRLGQARKARDRDVKEIRIAQLLEICAGHMEAGRLISGLRGNAVDCYQSVLSQDTGNVQARAGLQGIEDRYVQWIRTAMDNGEMEDAQRNLDTLRGLNPNHIALMDLERDMAELQKNIENTVEKSPTEGERNSSKEQDASVVDESSSDTAMASAGKLQATSDRPTLPDLTGTWEGRMTQKHVDSIVRMHLEKQVSPGFEGQASVSGGIFNCSASRVKMTPDSGNRYAVTFSGGGCNGEGELILEDELLKGHIDFVQLTGPTPRLRLSKSE